MPATLTSLRADAIRLTHDDVAYEPLVDDASLGALLFALDLLGRDAFDVPAMRYADRVALVPALDAARQYGLILQRHIDRADRATPLLPPSVTVAHAHAWVHAAAATAPEAERDRFCWRLARRLGNDPWGDGRPAIALANQQFGMFEEGFAEMEARVAAAVASAGAPLADEAAEAAALVEAVASDAVVEVPTVEPAAVPPGGSETPADPAH
jgi:hypothetical protein